MNENTAKKLLKKVQKGYNSIADDFDQTRKMKWPEFEIFLPYIKKDDKLSDIGCGNGRLLAYLKEKRKVEYTGIDNSSELLEHAKKQHKEANFMIGDMLSLPIKDNTFDTTVSIAALHHIPSKKLREKAVKELGRITKKNGTLIITCWNLFQAKYKKYIWKSRIKSILSLGKYDMRDTFIPWAKSGTNRYYYAFKESELEDLLTKNHLEIIKKQTGRNFLFICKKV